MTLVKSIYRSTAMAVLVSLIFSCNEQVNTPWEATCMTFLLGDKDGFGRELSEGEPWVLPGGTALPIDYRSSEDPIFTDIYPADMADNGLPTHKIEYTLNFINPPTLSRVHY